jgi:hypothetical protein
MMNRFLLISPTSTTPFITLAIAAFSTQATVIASVASDGDIKAAKIALSQRVDSFRNPSTRQ